MSGADREDAEMFADAANGPLRLVRLPVKPSRGEESAKAGFYQAGGESL